MKVTINQFIVIFTFSLINMSCQSIKETAFSEVTIIKSEASKFLFINNKKNKTNFDFKSYTYKQVNLFGVFHAKINKNNLKEGVYAFSSIYNHSMAFFLIYENKKTTILDISSNEGLLKSIEELIEFSERKKYCSELLNDYITRLVRVRYNINKKPNLRYDSNCDETEYSISELP